MPKTIEALGGNQTNNNKITIKKTKTDVKDAKSNKLIKLPKTGSD